MRKVLLCLVALCLIGLFAASAQAGPIRDLFNREDSSPCAGGVCQVPVMVEVAKPAVKVEKTVEKTKIVTATTETTAVKAGKFRDFLAKVIHFRRR